MGDTLKFDGILEIDQDRGVIYFHSLEGMSLLRICQLPTPIPEPLNYRLSKDGTRFEVAEFRLLDINFRMPQADWAPCSCGYDSDSKQNITCPVHGIRDNKESISPDYDPTRPVDETNHPYRHGPNTPHPYRR